DPSLNRLNVPQIMRPSRAFPKKMPAAPPVRPPTDAGLGPPDVVWRPGNCLLEGGWHEGYVGWRKLRHEGPCPTDPATLGRRVDRGRLRGERGLGGAARRPHQPAASADDRPRVSAFAHPL